MATRRRWAGSVRFEVRGEPVFVIAAPISAVTVKRAYRSGPVTISRCPGCAGCSSGSSSQVPWSSRRAGAVKAGAHAAVRTNERSQDNKPVIRANPNVGGRNA